MNLPKVKVSTKGNEALTTPQQYDIEEANACSLCSRDGYHSSPAMHGAPADDARADGSAAKWRELDARCGGAEQRFGDSASGVVQNFGWQ